MTGLDAIEVLLTIFGLACFSWLAYKAGYEKGYSAGVQAKWLQVEAQWQEKDDDSV